MGRIFLLIILIFSTLRLFSQEKREYDVSCIAFYNLENLFDTVPGSNDKEFTPGSAKRWNSERYYEKLGNMAKVINLVGRDLTGAPPAVIGVSEVENRTVLEDLVQTEPLKRYNYHIAHVDGPDRRGVDCALLYRPECFTVENIRMHRVHVAENPRFRTRDQILVSGQLYGEEMHFVVLHWPSRLGGQRRSKYLRNAAADVTRSIVDSLLALNANAKIFCMGDLNDDPVDESVTKHLKATGNKDKIESSNMYNPMLPLFKKGIGTLAYHDRWNLFDQIIMSPSLLNHDKSSFRYYKVEVFNKRFLMQTEGRFKGYPLRTFVGNTYQGGYSDHFPVCIYLVREK